MLDFTPLAEAIISLAVAAITIFLIPWLRERYGNETLEKARGWVQIAVYAAEKMYGAGHGAEKLAHAQHLLAQHNIKLDTATIMNMIDAEIKQMEQMSINLPEIEKVEEIKPPDTAKDSAGGDLNG
jgi:hypothetical protein